MQKNWIHYTLATVFFLFGIVQFNDPDFYIWIPAYFLVGLVPFAYAKYAFPEKTVIGLFIILLIWLGTYIPEITDWFKQGNPPILEGMKADAPHIESAREFFGLLLSIITIFAYLVLFNKKKQ